MVGNNLVWALIHCRGPEARPHLPLSGPLRAGQQGLVVTAMSGESQILQSVSSAHRKWNYNSAEL